MGRQLAIKVPPAQRKTRSLSETVRDILKKYCPKQSVFAAQVGASDAHVSEVLAGKKHWPDDWLDYVAEHYDFEGEVAQHFAEKRGLEVRPPRLMSKAEELRRLKYALAKHNAIGTAIQQEAAALPDDVFADGDEP